MGNVKINFNLNLHFLFSLRGFGLYIDFYAQTSKNRGKIDRMLKVERSLNKKGIHC